MLPCTQILKQNNFFHIPLILYTMLTRPLKYDCGEFVYKILELLSNAILELLSNAIYLLSIIN